MPTIACNTGAVVKLRFARSSSGPLALRDCRVEVSASHRQGLARQTVSQGDLPQRIWQRHLWLARRVLTPWL